MEAAVKVAIMAWKATRLRFMFFYRKEVSALLVCFKKECSYPPSWPVVGICIVHVRERIKIQCAMSYEKILAMLFRQMSNLVFNIESRVLSSFSSLRTGISSFNMHMLAISLLHREYKVDQCLREEMLDNGS
jgi:hypothetical protein